MRQLAKFDDVRGFEIIFDRLAILTTRGEQNPHHIDPEKNKIRTIISTAGKPEWAANGGLIGLVRRNLSTEPEICARLLGNCQATEAETELCQLLQTSSYYANLRAIGYSLTMLNSQNFIDLLFTTTDEKWRPTVEGMAEATIDAVKINFMEQLARDHYLIGGIGDINRITITLSEVVNSLKDANERRRIETLLTERGIKIPSPEERKKYEREEYENSSSIYGSSYGRGYIDYSYRIDL